MSAAVVRHTANVSGNGKRHCTRASGRGKLVANLRSPIMAVLSAVLLACALMLIPAPRLYAAENPEFTPHEYATVFTEPSGDWVLGGAFRYEDGALITRNVSGEAILWEPRWGNVEIETEVSVQEYGQYGSLRIHFGWQKKWNTYAVVFEGMRTLIRRYDGNHDVLRVLGQRNDFVLEKGRTYRVRVVAHDGTIDVYVDGEQILSGADPDYKYPVGRIGIEAGNDIQFRVSRFSARGDAVFAEAPQGAVTYAADFANNVADWRLTGNFKVDGNLLVTRNISGEAVLTAYSWDAADIEAQIVVDDFGQYGNIRIHTNWQAKWQNYAVSFSKTSSRVVRYDGNHDKVVLLGLAQFALEPGKAYNVRFRAVDGVFEVYVDGSKVLTAMDPERKYVPGHIAIEAGNDVQARIGSVQVVGVPSEGS